MNERTYREFSKLSLEMAHKTALDSMREMLHLLILKLSMSTLEGQASALMALIVEFNR